MSGTLPLFAAPDDGPARAEPLRALFEAYVRDRAAAQMPIKSLRPLREESAEVYREMWSAFVAYCVKRDIDPLEIDAADLENFLASRGEHSDLSLRYAWRMLALIDKVLRFAARAADRPENLAADALLKTERYRYANSANEDGLPEFLTAIEARRLIAHVTQVRAPRLEQAARSWIDQRNRTAVAVQLGAGVTPGEIRAMSVRDVIVAGGRHAGVPWKLALPGNGNSPARETPIADWAARELALWLRTRSEQGIAGELVFPSTRTGKPWSKASSYEAFRRIFEAAGIAAAAGGSYKLRHTFALRQLKKGRSDEEVAAWLGVQDLAVIRRYRRVLQAPVEVV